MAEQSSCDGVRCSFSQLQGTDGNRNVTIAITMGLPLFKTATSFAPPQLPSLHRSFLSFFKKIITRVNHRFITDSDGFLSMAGYNSDEVMATIKKYAII